MARAKIEVVQIEVDGTLVDAKMCRGCSEIKELSCFDYAKDGSAGGRYYICKVCRSNNFKKTYKPSENITRITMMAFNGVSVEAKKCTLCKELKPLSDYHNAKAGGAGGKNSGCKECVNAKTREYKEKNREKLREYDRMKWATNKEEERYKKVKYYNKEKTSERYKDWYKKNKEHVLAKAKERWRLRNSVTKTLTVEQLDETLRFFGNKCALSGENNFVLDHFIPISIADVGTIQGNIIPLSPFLNISKKDRNPFEWIQWIHIQEQIIPGNFEKLISYLAEVNKMTVDNYKEYVYGFYE